MPRGVTKCDLLRNTLLGGRDRHFFTHSQDIPEYRL